MKILNIKDKKNKKNKGSNALTTPYAGTYKSYKTFTNKTLLKSTEGQRYTTMVEKSLGLTKWARKGTDTILKFNVRRLHWYCTQEIEAIWSKLGAEVISGIYGDHGFIDNGADILAVAHLDVSPAIKQYRKSFFVSKRKIFNPSLDDRLGAYLICDVLPKLGLKYDILLTENEEIGMSTASDFKPEGKNYKWMFQFDRHGSDVVLYQYSDLETKEILTEAGFTIGIGSFSDICNLDHLGCKGFNVGTGYNNEHTRLCYADLNVTSKMVNTFINFYNLNRDLSMPHVETVPTYYLDAGGWEQYDGLDDYDYKDKPLFSDKWMDTPPYAPYDPKRGKSTEEYWDRLVEVYEAVNSKMIDTYGQSGNLDHMTWEEYSNLQGIHPSNSPSWTDEDWLIWTMMDGNA